MGTNPSLKLYLLGAFRLERDGTPLQLATRKTESLFAYLALYSQEHSREKLAALFWGDSSDQAARHSLSVALNDIRKIVASDLLLVDRASVQFNPGFPLWVDAREISDLSDELHRRLQIANFSIEILKSKIENYRADFLADFYDDWVLQEREQYRQMYLDALLALAQQHRANSEYARAMEYAQRVLAVDAANERAHQHVMFCFALTGERQKALAQYEKCARALRVELALDQPSPETIALYEWIRQTPTTPSLAARLTNLPLPLTSFIGRTHEMQELKAQLERARLVTLTGAGGSGKTRFAVQAGLGLLDTFRDGVWWIDLAPLNEPARVTETLLRALGLRVTGEQSPHEFLLDTLREQERLLVLDNCEHLLDACAHLIQALLSACPALKILATSREPLNVLGEVVVPLPTLPFPNPNALALANLLMQYEAIRLFVERAQSVKPSFALNEQNAFAVAQICARLDGIPLALELAAACARTLSASEIAARLDERFALLTRGERTALPRQQTLYALIDWSYNLLNQAERALFQELAVFTGGFTLNAAERVTRGAKTMNLLARLVEKSLVVMNAQGETTRYTMLETIREFARERLRARGAYELVQARHLDFFHGMAQQCQLFGRDKWYWLNTLEAEHDNVRAAMTFALERGAAGAERALQLLTPLMDFFWYRGYVAEAREWLDKLFALHPPPSRAHAMALQKAGWFARGSRDLNKADALLKQSLEMSQAIGDRNRMAWAYGDLGLTAREKGDTQQALVYLHQALALYQEGDDAHGTSNALYFLGETYTAQGDFETGQRYWKQGLEIVRAQGDIANISWGLEGLGSVAFLQGDMKSAMALQRESLEIKVKLFDKLGIAFSLEALAQLAAAQQDYPRAVILWGASAQLRQRLGLPSETARGNVYTSLSANAEVQLGNVAFEALWQRGGKLFLEQAIAFALE